MCAELKPVLLSNRHPGFPEVFEVKSHPKVSNRCGHIYIFLQDQSGDALGRTKDAENSTTAPRSLEEAADIGKI